MALNETTASSGLGQGRRVLEERYELTDRIGAGGMAEVWRARDLRLDREVAVKLLPATGAEEGERRRKIEREARALAAASHPNIVAVYDYGEAPESGGTCVPYLVMELVDGTDLHRHLADRGPLPVAETQELMGGVLAGVAHAHGAGVVHGDLKPANIFVGPHGPKVGDFGVARILHEETGTTTVAATPTFAAPEVLKGDRATPASDVYSAACLAFELMAGRPPYEGANAWDVASKHIEAPVPKLRRFRSDIPADVEAAIGRAMSKEPKRRYADASAFAAALGQPVAAAVAQPVAEASETVPVAAPFAAPVVEATQAFTRPGRRRASGVPFGARMRERVRTVVRSSPNGRILLLLLIPLLLLIAFLAMRDTGPLPRAVPDVIGQPYQQAAGVMSTEGFEVDVSFRPITEGEPGRVLQTIPAPDEMVEPGTEVHLIAGALAPTPAPTPAPVVQSSNDEDDDDDAPERPRRRRKERDD